MKEPFKLYINETLIVETCEIASSYFKKLKGLMFTKSKNFSLGKGLLFKDCNSIHMFFMFFPIDVVFLDKEFKVLKVIRKLNICSFAFGPKNTYYTLELPLNGATNIHMDDYILIKE